MHAITNTSLTAVLPEEDINDIVQQVLAENPYPEGSEQHVAWCQCAQRVADKVETKISF